MLEFSVTLNKTDIKKFIFYRIMSQPYKFLVPVLCHFGLLFFVLVVSFFVQINFFIFVATSIIFFFIGCCYIYRNFLVCKKMFIQGLDLVGKERNFFVNKQYLHIIFKGDFDFCGRYFFYNLKGFKQNSGHLFLLFSENIYIIIPVRCLKVDQMKNLVSILKSVKN